MDNADIFYILGGALAVLAVVVSFLGLRSENFPATKGLMSGVIALFALLVVGTAAFAVASARDEQAHREHEQAEKAEEHAAAEETTQAEAGGAEGQGSAGADGAGGEATGGEAAGGEAAGGGATTLQLAADETDLAFDETALRAKPGELTIDFDNPAIVPHNVAIQQGGDIVAESQTVTQSKTSVSANLKPGRYEFICTVPGHAEAGMRGVLQVG